MDTNASIVMNSIISPREVFWYMLLILFNQSMIQM